MTKQAIITPLIMCALLLCAVSSFFCLTVSANLMPPSQATYTFGPEGRPIDSLEQNFAKPGEMFSILPGRPVAAREKDGSRVFFSPDGKMTLRIAPDGTKEYSLGWKSKTVDAKGELQKQSEVVKGTNEVVIKNEKGEVLGYQEIGFGSKVLKEYDYQKNLTKSYSYDKYGKNTEYALNELTQTKTVFDKNALPKHDIDFEGNIVAVYQSDRDGFLEKKVDAVGNTTYFDKTGNMTHTTNLEGSTVLKYEYKKDDDGRFILVKAQSHSGDTTYFKDGKQQYVINDQGVKTAEYYWDGSKLVYSYDFGAEETTYYDINGKEQFTSQNNSLTKEWLYFKGRLVGFFDGNNGTTTLYQYQRDDISVFSGTGRPSAETIQRWYDEGLIEKLRNYAAN